VHSLGQLEPGSETYATAINSHGVIVGNGTSPIGWSVPWVYDPAVGHIVQLPGTASAVPAHARGINDNGDIVGDLTAVSSVDSMPVGTLPVKWAAATHAATILLQFGNTLAGTANAINASGAIVGEVASGAVLWASAEATPIALAPERSSSRAIDINDAGVIVGSIAAYHGQDIMTPTAVAWSLDRHLQLLVDSNSTTSSYASAVNRGGTIVGVAAGRATQF
jgi:uncharacterized membrane protein